MISYQMNYLNYKSYFRSSNVALHITNLLTQFYYANPVTKLFLNLSRFLSKKLDF